MIKLMEKVKELRNKEALAEGSDMNIEQIGDKALESISERIRDIQVNNQDLFSFAYNLRK